MADSQFPEFILGNNDERANYVESQLSEYNKQRASSLWQDARYVGEALQLYVLDSSGSVIGGLIGRTNDIPEWCQISDLWVTEFRRGQGLGKELLHRAEAEALRRGCHYVRLATSDYQAPGFYEKQGYQLYGKLENCPPRETVYYFCKAMA